MGLIYQESGTTCLALYYIAKHVWSKLSFATKVKVTLKSCQVCLHHAKRFHEWIWKGQNLDKRAISANFCGNLETHWNHFYETYHSDIS